MIVKYKHLSYDLSSDIVEGWQEIGTLLLIARSRDNEIRKKIASLLIRHKEMIREMIELDDDKLKDVLNQDYLISYDNILMKGMKTTPFKKK